MKPSTASKEHLPIIKKAEGKFCWDAKGQKYLDFTGSNLTVILGYKNFNFYSVPNFPGVSYLEPEASKRLSKYTGTKHFRYFKNGHNAVDCAVRLARSLFNKQSSIYFIGYAGTSDDYISTTSNSNGIAYSRSVQAIIEDGKISRWQGNQLCLTKGIFPEAKILVYESRFEAFAKKIKADIKICDHLKSGVNGLYEKIDADFHLYGKSLANGYPVAVMTGEDKLMKRIDEIYYSTTFGGENTGLEGILQTLNEYDRKKWLELKDYADSVLPQWQSIPPKKIKEFTKNGILFNGYWQVMTCHTKEDIDQLSKIIKKVGI